MPSKKPDFKLYADECFPLTTVLYLRSIGYSIKHSSEYNFLNKSDLSHLKKSNREKRTLITLDRDFLGYTIERIKDTKGAIVIKAGSNSPKHINRLCKKQLKKLSNKKLQNSLFQITDTKIKYSSEK